MDLIATAWVPSGFEAARTLVVPANYGTEGSQANWEWTPSYVPANGPQGRNPHVQVDNDLSPIVWNLEVVPQDELARYQTQVRQQARQLPANYTPPGTASLDFKG